MIYIPWDTRDFKLAGECVRHQFFGGGATLNEPRIPRLFGMGSVNLFTCRSGLSLLHAITKCESYGLTFDAINSDLDSSIELWKQKHPNEPISNKPFYNMLIDDKNYPACVNGIDWVMVSRELLKQR